MKSILFTPPTTTYTHEMNELIWIPRNISKKEDKVIKPLHRKIYSHDLRLPETSSIISLELKHNSKQSNIESNLEKIPCSFINYPNGSNFLILYFHANSEDIGSILNFLKFMSNYLKINVLAIEYPGYGLYEGIPDLNKINEDAKIIYDFCMNYFCINPNNILIIGRSLGTAPAIYLSGLRTLSALILISPFKSIKDILQDKIGKLAFILPTLEIDNIGNINKINSPILFIHGINDNIISFEHSLALFYEANKKSGIYKSLNGHNDLHILNDISIPISNFLQKNKIFIKNDSKYCISINKELNAAPKYLKNYTKKFSFINYILEKIGGIYN